MQATATYTKMPSTLLPQLEMLIILWRFNLNQRQKKYFKKTNTDLYY